MKNPLKISVYGLGNFGYALLKHLTKEQTLKRFRLFGYDINRQLIQHLIKHRRHISHHRTTVINKKVEFARSVEEFIQNTDILILAVTSAAIKDVVFKIKPHINQDIIILNTAKALENHSGKRFSQVISQQLSCLSHQYHLAMLSGGTIASDLFQHEPLGVDIACKNKKTLSLLQNIFTSDNLDVYPTTDLVGVEYASAFKNVIAILAGIVHGLGFSYGSETHLISRAAAEAERLAIHLGAKAKTFSLASQCWGNDLLMSCTGNTRNRKFGILIGKSKSGSEALKKIKKEKITVEGINTLQVMKKIIGGNSSCYPLLFHINEIVFRNKNPRETILRLLENNLI